MLKTASKQGEPLRATVDVTLVDGAATNIEFSDVRIDDKIWSEDPYDLPLDSAVGRVDSDYSERLESLRSVIGTSE